MTRSLTQLFRYGLIGIATNLAGYCLYLLVTSLGAEPKITMTMLYLTGASLSYLGNRKWTFGHNGSWLGSTARYTLAHTAGYLLNLGLLVTFVDHYHYPHQWVQGIAIFIVAGFLFITFKFFVFSEASIFSGERK